jgi:hypothetical protein
VTQEYNRADNCAFTTPCYHRPESIDAVRRLATNATALAGRYDPTGKFRNACLARHVLG